MHNLEDLLEHYSDLLKDTSDILKKTIYVPNYKFKDANDKDKQIKTIEDLKTFMREEMEAYLQSLEDL